MNDVRKRLLNRLASAKYTELHKHKDLIAFYVCDGYFAYNPETSKEEETDFNEIIAVVEKDWLFDLIKSENNNIRTDIEALRFLQEEYTSDDSEPWFEKALAAHKIVMIDFN